MSQTSRHAALAVRVALLAFCLSSSVQAAPATHVVRPGETLWRIAARYGVTESQLRAWNGLDSSLIMAGQRLHVSPAARSDSIHVVRPGETLSAIARRYGISQAELKRRNRLSSDRLLRGQKLIVSRSNAARTADGPAPAAGGAATARRASSAQASEASERPAVRASGADARTHVVQPGEYLTAIARRYGTTVGQLRTLNGLRTDTLQPGQRLIVSAGTGRPGSEPADAATPRAAPLSSRPPAVGSTAPAAPPAESQASASAGADAAHAPGQQGAVGASAATSAGTEPAAAGGRTAIPPARSAPTQGARADTAAPAGPGPPDGPPRSAAPAASVASAGPAALPATAREPSGGLPDSTRVPPAATVEAAEEEPPCEYIVRPGDTLSDIAARHEVGLQLVRSLNGLKSDIIQPGQRLRLRPSPTEEPVHVVQAGETLTAIAARYGLSVAGLRELNGIAGDRITVGQKLRLRQASRAVHIVERGDALWEIARAYGMSIEDLRALNGLSSDRIYPGQELVLSRARAQTVDEYETRPGDSLDRIARLHQMSVAELKQLNQLQGSLIHPGQRLKVRPLLGRSPSRADVQEWPSLCAGIRGLRPLAAGNGPYFFARPRAKGQRHSRYFEGHALPPPAAYRQARKLLVAFEREIDRLPRLSAQLEGWHIVVDPGHGGLDPGAIVQVLDSDGTRSCVTEDEYAYDLALRVYALLRLHGAVTTMTVLSPNHLIRGNSRPDETFVHEKNEVYNSERHNQSKDSRTWPSGRNLRTRVHIARDALAKAPRGRRVFLSFHYDVDPRSPEAPLVLYYASRDGRRVDGASRSFARSLLPSLGAGAHTRGQALGVLRDNPADYKVLLELRNMAYRDHVWAMRFEELRQRDAEKVVQSLLEFARQSALSAQR